AAAQSAAYRQTFDVGDLRTEPATRFRLEQPGRPHREIVVFRDALQLGNAADLSVWAQTERELITTVDEAKQGLQRVIAVWPAARHEQNQIELGGRRAVKLTGGLAHAGLRPSTFRSPAAGAALLRQHRAWRAARTLPPATNRDRRPPTRPG